MVYSNCLSCNACHYLNMFLFYLQDYNGNIPFHVACREGNIDLVRILLNQADLLVPNRLGMWGIHIALTGGHKEYVEIYVLFWSRVESRSSNIWLLCWFLRESLDTKLSNINMFITKLITLKQDLVQFLLVAAYHLVITSQYNLTNR